MASKLSDFLSSKFLNFIKGTSAGTAPPSLYVALYSSDPGPAGTGGTDVTATINAAGRVLVTYGAVTARAILNDIDVDFGLADAGATVTHFGVWDAASAGNYLFGSALVTPRTVSTADPVKFLIGDLGANFN